MPPAVLPPGLPASVTVAVSPVRPGHAVAVEYRVNGGPVRQAMALPAPGTNNVQSRLFRALLPGQPSGVVEFLPVLRVAGQPISPRLGESDECSRYEVGGCGSAPAGTAGSSAMPGAEPEPLWAWDTRFLWTGTVTIRKEEVGDLPDGLRINWHLVEGSFVGPDHAGVILPGAADYMRIRQDGIGIVAVTELLRTRTGARLYCTYGGVFDLGADGYARALRCEFDPAPTFVGTPTYTTADKELAWLNRAQCIGVGRVDMKALRLEYDVYAVQVGGRKHSPACQREGGGKARSGTGDPAHTVSVRLTVNGTSHTLSLDSRSSLLDVLRELLGLTGTKKGCDHGQCGACTVHLDGRGVLSCLTPAAQADGRQVTTIEGLSPGGDLHPMQQAFIDHDALQCGYCTPGQIMAAVACVSEGQATSPEQIREYMSGNICRCGAYVGIVAAIQDAASKMRNA
jgi:aerobic-type carbon monoxide dehydrogenase small subunit (CoxS/CutS family)